MWLTGLLTWLHSLACQVKSSSYGKNTSSATYIYLGRNTKFEVVPMLSPADVISMLALASLKTDGHWRTYLGIHGHPLGSAFLVQPCWSFAFPSTPSWEIQNLAWQEPVAEFRGAYCHIDDVAGSCYWLNEFQQSSMFFAIAFQVCCLAWLTFKLLTIFIMALLGIRSKRCCHLERRKIKVGAMWMLQIFAIPWLGIWQGAFSAFF